MKPDLLKTYDLRVGYKHQGKETTLLQDLNLTLRQGTLTALVGRNGAGKSTLLKALTGTEPPLSGRILLNDKDINDYSIRQKAALIGLVSTERVQAGALTVTELVALGRQPHTGMLGRLSQHDHDIVSQAIEQVGITGKANQYIASLSDGERQKAMTAKALAQQTPIIVLDEPTAFLDTASRIETIRLLSQLAHDQGKAVLLSCHDMAHVILTADNMWVITAENQLIDDTPKALIERGDFNKMFTSQGLHFDTTLLDFTFK